MQLPVSIILVDDHTIVRKGLRTLIESMGGYMIQGEFDNGRHLTDNIPLPIAPQLIIMDIAMPLMDGKKTMEWFAENNISYPVLILTLDTSEKTIVELFRLGVRGYISKTCTAQELKQAIDDIVQTGYYHNEFMINALHRGIRETEDDRKKKIITHITEREKLFLQLVCDEKEYTYDQIADIMDVHRRTVDGYREALFEKFNVKSKTGLVLFAIKYGLVAHLT
jgi:two-component system invasion response regulator UvrY